jgi:hypothetical protein
MADKEVVTPSLIQSASSLTRRVQDNSNSKGKILSLSLSLTLSLSLLTTSDPINKWTQRIL